MLPDEQVARQARLGLVLRYRDVAHGEDVPPVGRKCRGARNATDKPRVSGLRETRSGAQEHERRCQGGFREPREHHENRIMPQRPLLQAATHRGDTLRVEAEPMHPAHEPGVFDLDAAIHDH